MKKKLLVITSLILSVFLSATTALADNCSVSEKRLAIYFGNGMSNNMEDAERSQTALQLKTESFLQSQGYTLNYDIAYNENEEWYYQILEVFRQRNVEEWSLFYRWLSSLELAPDWFQGAMKSAAQSIDSINYVADADLQSHIEQYKSEIEDCKRLLIIAHSQGNFYANSAWQAIYEWYRLSMDVENR